MKSNDSLLGNRGGTSVWTTLKEPGVVSLASLGEEGMYMRMGTFFSGVGVLSRRLLTLLNEVWSSAVC